MLNRLRNTYEDLATRQSQLPPWKARFVDVVHIGVVLWREASRDKLAVRASQLSFWTTVAIVPLFLLAFAVTGAVGLMEDTEPAVRAFLLNTLIAGSAEGAVSVIEELTASANIRTMGIVGVAGITVFGLRLYTQAEEAYNDIFHARMQRGLLQRLAYFYAGVTLGPLLIATGFLMTARLDKVSDTSLFQWMGPVALTATALIMAIRILPSVEVSWGAAALGGGLSAVMFELGKEGFNIYTSVFGTQDALAVVYGSLGILPLFLLWLYVLWTIVLVGVEVAYVADHAPLLLRGQRFRARDRTDRLRQPDSLFGIAVLGEVTDHHGRGQGPIGRDALAERLGARPDHVQLAIDVWLDVGLLAETAAGKLLPARPPMPVGEAHRLWRSVAAPQLVRPSAGQSAAERVEEAFDDAVSQEPLLLLENPP